MVMDGIEDDGRAEEEKGCGTGGPVSPPADPAVTASQPASQQEGGTALVFAWPCRGVAEMVAAGLDPPSLHPSAVATLHANGPSRAHAWPAGFDWCDHLDHREAENKEDRLT
ncbi:hypothetical protein GGTG_00514 [Gaeumannomyces tritici R3-111a-1]|uniref:Uncharacterized protein n=1 Tax=Gaeumannomyces tritici (strain R3-111a-1) TaxID=644352 RepID=J3NGX8_GAET3|nr:hypothetical protein GGTG_00514 [Gaeumannomyces tritici R3-111a-1]EJT80518.1 hypothetical protein GGTG_00514 [Gaeumannomyces tritici R3-111a-1]